jgi:hypothetical protein
VCLRITVGNGPFPTSYQENDPETAFEKIATQAVFADTEYQSHFSAIW